MAISWVDPKSDQARAVCLSAGNNVDAQIQADSVINLRPTLSRCSPVIVPVPAAMHLVSTQIIVHLMKIIELKEIAAIEH